MDGFPDYPGGESLIFFRWRADDERPKNNGTLLDLCWIDKGLGDVRD